MIRKIWILAFIVGTTRASVSDEAQVLSSADTTLLPPPSSSSTYDAVRAFSEIPETLDETDCGICKKLFKDGQKIQMQNAACTLLDAKKRDPNAETMSVRDEEWKLHSLRVFATNGGIDSGNVNGLIEQVQSLIEGKTDLEADNILHNVCGVLGATASPCTCPADLTKYEALIDVLKQAVARSAKSGDVEISTTSSLEDNSMSLLEMGRRTLRRKKRQSARATMKLELLGLSECAGARKDKLRPHEDPVDRITDRVDKREGLKRKVGNFGVGAVLGGATTAIATAKVSGPFMVIYHILTYLGAEFLEEWDSIIARDIVESVIVMIRANWATLQSMQYKASYDTIADLTLGGGAAHRGRQVSSNGVEERAVFLSFQVSKDYTNAWFYRKTLHDKLVRRKLNAHRGIPGMSGLELTCGLGGRPGKIAGDPKEGEKLVSMFLEAAENRPWNEAD
eukprot:g848.t1